MAKPQSKTPKTTRKVTSVAIAVGAKVDEKLVKEVVEHIHAILIKTLHKGLSEIGEYVFSKFFNSDPEMLHSKSHGKGVSFRSLLARCETLALPLRRSALHNAVGVAAMQHQITGKDVAYKQLPPSHQVALLPLRDPEKVEKAAKTALSKRLSVLQVKAAVKEETAKAPKDGDREKRGPKPKPLIVKTLDRSLSLFTLESGRRSFTKAHVEELNDEQAKTALKSAEGLVESLEKLIVKLRERV